MECRKRAYFVFYPKLTHSQGVWSRMRTLGLRALPRALLLLGNSTEEECIFPSTPPVSLVSHVPACGGPPHLSPVNNASYDWFPMFLLAALSFHRGSSPFSSSSSFFPPSSSQSLALLLLLLFSSSVLLSLSPPPPPPTSPVSSSLVPSSFVFRRSRHSSILESTPSFRRSVHDPRLGGFADCSILLERKLGTVRRSGTLDANSVDAVLARPFVCPP